MLFVLACSKCGTADLRRSRIRNVGEVLVLLFAVPYRCRLCDHREMVFRFAVPRDQQGSQEAELTNLLPVPVGKVSAVAAPVPAQPRSETTTAGAPSETSTSV